MLAPPAPTQLSAAAMQSTRLHTIQTNGEVMVPVGGGPSMHLTRPLRMCPSSVAQAAVVRMQRVWSGHSSDRTPVANNACDCEMALQAVSIVLLQRGLPPSAVLLSRHRSWSCPQRRRIHLSPRAMASGGDLIHLPPRQHHEPSMLTFQWPCREGSDPNRGKGFGPILSGN